MRIKERLFCFFFLTWLICWRDSDIHTISTIGGELMRTAVNSTIGRLTFDPRATGCGDNWIRRSKSHTWKLRRDSDGRKSIWCSGRRAQMIITMHRFELKSSGDNGKRKVIMSLKKIIKKKEKASKRKLR